MIPSHRALLATLLLIPTLSGISSAADVDLSGDPLPPGAVARLGGTHLRLSTVIRDIVYSPDGRTLFSASKSVRAWDAATGRLVREMAAHPHSMITSLAVSPNGRLLAWAGRDSTVRIVEAATGRELNRLAGHKYYSECAAFSPDGKVLATGGRDDLIRLWDAGKGDELRALDCPGQTTRLAYLPDGKSLIAFSRVPDPNAYGECRSLDVATGKVLRRWPGARGPVALSPDGKALALGTKDARLEVWDLGAGKEPRSFDLPRRKGVIEQEPAKCAAFSPDGKLLAVGDLTDRVRVWELGTGKELYCSPPLKNWVGCLAFSPDGETLAVGNWMRILLWEATTGKDRLPLGGHANQVNRVRFAPDGKSVATWSTDALILWDPLTGREQQRWSDKGRFVGFTPRGALLTGSQGAIVEWEAAAGKTLRTFRVFEPDEPDDVAGFEVAFAPDGKAMVSGANDRTIRLWSLATGKELWRAKRTNKGVRFPADIGGHTPLGFTQDGRAVVSVGDDAVVHFWDGATGRELRWFAVEAREAVLSPDGRFLVTDGKVEVAPDGMSQTGSAAPPRLWDLTTDRAPRPAVLYPKDAGPPAFSPDGSVVAVDDRGEIVLIERASGHVIRRLKGHRDDVCDLAFAPDGRLLVSGSYDLTGLVWDVTGLMRDRRFPELRLNRDELEAAWADLSDSDASKAYRAVWKLVAAPGDAVPFLGGRVKAELPADPGRVARLIGDLDSKTFAERETAARELEKLGELVHGGLRKALDRNPSEEVRSRISKLLDRPAWPERDADRLRALRSVSVLGQIGTPEARKVLDALAKGAPEARLTQEAQVTQQRLTRRAEPPR